MGFKGSSVHTINDNGRLSIPSKMRDMLRNKYAEDTLVLVTSQSGCLVVYPTAEWDAFEQTLPLNPKSPRIAKIIRDLYANMDDVSIDGNGRILIPPKLRKLADLDGECIVLGINNRMEIWNKARYDALMSESYENDGSDDVGDDFNQLIL